MMVDLEKIIIKGEYKKSKRKKNLRETYSAFNRIGKKKPSEKRKRYGNKYF